MDAENRDVSGHPSKERMTPATMLVSVLLVAVLVGWWSDHQQRAARQTEALTELERQTAAYKDYYQLKNRIRVRGLEGGFVRPAEALVRSGAMLTAETTKVSLSGPQFSDADVATIGKTFRTVRTVHLGGENFSIESLRHLTRLPALESVSLVGEWVSDDAMKSFGDLNGVTSIAIQDAPISNAGLAELIAQRPDLETLVLRNVPITDDGIVALRALSHLHDLGLDGTDITDTGAASLRLLTNLQSLSLRNTKLSDVSLTHLQELRGLQILFVSDTAMTADGIAGLQKHLADCRIVFDAD